MKEFTAVEGIAVKEIDAMAEIEYNIRVGGEIFYTVWSTEQQMIDLWSCDTLEEAQNNIPESWAMVRRRKAGEVEYV